MSAAAAQTFNYMWRYQRRLTALYQTPELAEDYDEAGFKHYLIKEMLEQIRQTGRVILTEYESKQVLEAYDIPTVPTKLATWPARRSGSPGRSAIRSSSS